MELCKYVLPKGHVAIVFFLIVKMDIAKVKIKEEEPSENAVQAEQIQNELLPILQQLIDEPISTLFRTAVDTLVYPSYKTKISDPIDFGTIRTRPLQLFYTDPWQLLGDIRRVFANAVIFNHRKTTVYTNANKVK